MAKLQLRLFPIFLLLLIGTQTSLHAQQTLGAKWDVPADPDSAKKQLSQFNELGISVLEITKLPSEAIWTHIDSLGFEVYGNLDIRFPITQTFANPDSSLIEDIRQKSQGYLSQPSVRSIGLFTNGNIYDPTFWEAVSPFAEELKQTNNINLYHRSKTATHTDTNVISSAVINIPVTPSNFESPSLPKNSVSGYEYNSTPELKELLTPFKNFVTTVNKSHDAIIFLDATWIDAINKKYPQFSEILPRIASEPDPVFPLPQEQVPAPKSTSFPIIVLMIIWGTVGLHYNTSPLYRKSLFRYFVAHKFFIDDIFKRLIRSSMPATIILVQNAILMALAVYSAFSVLFTTLGQEAFFYHFPNILLAGSSAITVLAWTFILILLSSFLGIIWLYFTHKKINSVTQIAIVYAWPLQLNFLFCTVAITFGSPAEPFSTVLFTALAILLFFLSFIFTAMDISRFSRSKATYHLKTTIPYLIILSGLFGWAATKNEWIEVLSLALNLT